MISMILESYMTILLSVGLAATGMLILGLYWIFRPRPVSLGMSTDINTIAGDDILSTQLDLARAYIETDNRHLAKPILQLVLEQGSKTQVAEAKILLGLI